jgi:hypothetical protein
VLLCLSALLIAFAGCVAPQAASPPTATPVQSAGLQTHTGLGYTISYPAGAVVRAGEISPRWMPDVLERTTISGPKVETYTREGRPSDLVLYSLQIWVYPNPAGLDAETWARQRILDDWQRAREENLPLGGAPVRDGAIREDRVGQAVVAGYPAFRAAFWGGDSHIVRYYVASR